MSTIRTARVISADSQLETVQRYMPSNYTAENRDGEIVITGTDSLGWTLDDYVLPRLASGGHIAKEISS